MSTPIYKHASWPAWHSTGKEHQQDVHDAARRRVYINVIISLLSPSTKLHFHGTFHMLRSP